MKITFYLSVGLIVGALHQGAFAAEQTRKEETQPETAVVSYDDQSMPWLQKHETGISEGHSGQDAPSPKAEYMKALYGCAMSADGLKLCGDMFDKDVEMFELSSDFPESTEILSAACFVADVVHLVDPKQVSSKKPQDVVKKCFEIILGAAKNRPTPRRSRSRGRRIDFPY